MMVEITNEEYRKLLMTKINYTIVLRGLIEKSELGYIDEILRWDDEAINNILELLEPDEYKERIYKLKKQRQDKEREAESNE